MVEVKKEIVLPNGATFQISIINKVYFNGQPLVRLSEDVNLDKLAMLMVKDKKLIELTTKYMEYESIRGELEDKMESIRHEISEMIDEAKTLTYAKLSERLGCINVKKEIGLKYVEYSYKNFSLKVEVKNYEFSCLTQEVGSELYSLCPNIKLRIAQSGNTITFFVNDQILYTTSEFPIRKVLSFLHEAVINGEFPRFVELLRRLYMLYLKSMEGGGLIVEIIHRIEELARMVS